MATFEEIRDLQRATWADLAGGWAKWDALIMDQMAPVTTAMIEALGIAEDQRHLDIASGTGEPGLTIARLAPKGRVVLSDLSPQMLEIAQERARSQEMRSLETRVCGAEELPFAEETFDSVSVRFGHMFFPDPLRATAECARVLQPGGRLCASVWANPDRNPWTTVIVQAISSQLALTQAGPDEPSMFRCAAPFYLSNLYERAGLGDIVEWDVEVELVAGSPEEYWEVMTEHASLAVRALRQVGAQARRRVRERAIALVSVFEKGGAVRVPGLARCAIGTKPGT